ncbi:MAG: hypothetical protein BGO31_18305 [Bacteroidetes bacterium 43-16]|nr:MAG: hypothetical protein BGO31_18305 [Bacteroidetes bacterium 43-16]
MKRILAATAICVAISMAAQAQVSVGLEAGATYNTLSQYIKGENRDTEGNVGFRAGFNVNIPLGEESRFHLQPALIFDGNSGSSSTYSAQSRTGAGIPFFESDSRDYRINQLQVPVMFLFKAGDPVYDKEHFFFGLGPTFAFTFSGRYHQVYSNALNGSERVKDVDAPLRIGSGNYEDYARFNIGGGAVIGYEFKSGIYLKGHYNYFFNNMHPLADSKNKMHATQAGLTLGFFFKKFEQYKY